MRSAVYEETRSGVHDVARLHTNKPEQHYPQLFGTVDHALDARRSNKIDRLIRQAQFPFPDASIAELQYVPGRRIDESRMKRYATHQWRDDPTNLLIISPTGGGKTYIVCAIGIAACHNEYSVYFTRMDVLARKLLMARSDSKLHDALLTKLRDTDLLIIDELCEASHKSSNAKQKIMRS